MGAASLTGIVLIIVLMSKFTHGAYLAVVAMAVLFALMLTISNHYRAVEQEVALRPDSDRALPSRVRGVVLVQRVNLPTLRAIAFARAARSTTLTAVTVAVDDDEVERILDEWEAEDFGTPLKVIASPYREITGPFIKYVNELRTENPRDVVSVYIPEYVVGPLVGAAAAQPDGAADPHPPALHDRCHGHVRALPAAAPEGATRPPTRPPSRR